MEQNDTTWASPVKVRQPRIYANMPMNALKTDMNALKTDMNAIKLSILDQTCRDMGKQQGDLRIYSSEECDALNGIYHTNGECTNKDGGSFSEKCGMLYKWTNSMGVRYANDEAAAYTNDLVGSVAARQIPYGTTSKKNEGDYKKNWAAEYGSDSAVPAVPVGGRRKRTRRGKGRRRGTRRYRK